MSITAPSPTNVAFLQKALEVQTQAIDQALLAYLQQYQEPRTHYGMIHYHFGFADAQLQALQQGEFLKRGKRLRALLCLVLGRMIQVPAEVANVIMLATEVMHCASLVHDDIQDQDAMRWGRPTINTLFGMEQAINVGDALIGMVYELLLKLRSQGVAPERLCDVLEVYNQTHLKMCEGQHFDIQYKYFHDISIAEYLHMIQYKTAAACECITHAMSLLAECDQQARQHLCNFGQSFGMLYQICDDMRGIWSESEKEGKEVGKDIFYQKASLPLLYGFQHGSDELRALLQKDFTTFKHLSRPELDYIRKGLYESGAYQMCYGDAKLYYSKTLQALKALNITSTDMDVLETIVNLCMASIGTKE